MPSDIKAINLTVGVESLKRKDGIKKPGTG